MSAFFDALETCRPSVFYGCVGAVAVIVGIGDRLLVRRWRA